jgi:polyisoprenoid-binding protein YceI
MRGAVLLLVLSASVASANSYTVATGPHGKVRFKVEGPLDDVVGEGTAVSGNMELDPAKWATGKAWVAVELARLRTGIEQRDEDMREQFLQTRRFPFALLVIDSVSRPSAAAIVPGLAVEGEASGSFELHGFRHNISFPVTLKADDSGKITVKGAFEVVFADYNIQRPQRLFIKLGETAEVSFDIVFAPKVEAAPPPVAVEPGSPPPPEKPTVAEVTPLGPKPKPRPQRKPKPEVKAVSLFTGDDPKAKGEKLFHDAGLGSPGNKLTCYHCHAVTDERSGLIQKDGYARAATTLFNSAQRGRYWNGFATDVGKASDICVKMYMNPKGMTEQQRSEISAFLTAISPDPAPELDYRVLYRTYDSDLRDPVGGDLVKGKKLADEHCMLCHLDGRAAPVWAFGLYEADWLVRRVRHLEGHGAHSMPPFSIARLPDSELRDIVTYLAGPKNNKPIFDRTNFPSHQKKPKT